VKFEKVRIDFQVTFSVCCHPKLLLPWQRDVTTSPFYKLLPERSHTNVRELQIPNYLYGAIQVRFATL